MRRSRSIYWCVLPNRCGSAWHGTISSCARLSNKGASYMQPLTAEWVDKAEGDFATLLREIRARKRPNYDSACFHAQQCTEKYLKARLQEAGIPFGKTHDLPALLHLLSA